MGYFRHASTRVAKRFLSRSGPIIPKSMKRNLECYVLGLLFCVLASRALYAQDFSDDDDAVIMQKTASLSMRVDHLGIAEFTLHNPSEISDRADWNALFTTRWNCSMTADQIPEAFRSSRMNAQTSASMAKFWNDTEKQNVHATCRSLLQRHGFEVQGSVDFQPVLDLLKKDGVQLLLLDVSLPEVHSKRISGADQSSKYARFGLLRYQLSVDKPAKPLQVEFGYTRSNLITLSLYTGAFVLLPILLVLVMRSMALRRGEADRAAAWFSFMKTTNLCINGMFLFWMVADLSTRHELVNLVQFAGWESGWRSLAANEAVLLAPPWTVYVVCTALSYKVFVRMRNVSLRWGQFMARQLGQVGKVYIPLTLYFAGVLIMFRDLRAGMALFALGWLASITCVLLHQKLEKNHPSAITSGPLRDRIFALAHNMGVRVRQVFVVPAAQSGIANAFATTKQTVIFTDYLIEKLNQREVDAVAAHELTHLQHKHAQTLTVMIWCVFLLPHWILGIIGGFAQGFLIFLPGAERLRAVVENVFRSGWTELALLIGMYWGFLYIQKRFEYTADAGAVRATRDPEAIITGLVKISRVNLTPLQWSRRSEAMLTHPSTMRRAERIARFCGMPESHLQTLLAQMENAPQPATATGYSLTADKTGMVSTRKSSGRALKNLLFLIALHLLPVTAIAFCLEKIFPRLGSQWWVLLAGAPTCVFLYFLGMAWMSRNNNRRMVNSIMRDFTGKTGSFRIEDGIPVGFAPGASPRFFVSSYNWDHGLLFLSPEKMVFMGEHATFGLRRDQVRSMLLAGGAPSWMKWRRVYFAWEDKENGRSGTFNLLPLRPKGMFQVDSQRLYLQTRAWRNASQPPAGSAELPGAPAFGAVTSMSAKEVGKLSRTFGITMMMIMLGAGLTVVLGLESAWCICATVLLIRVFEMIPHWLYHERAFVFDGANAPVRVRPMAKDVAPPPPPPPPSPAKPQAEQEPVPVN